MRGQFNEAVKKAVDYTYEWKHTAEKLSHDDTGSRGKLRFKHRLLNSLFAFGFLISSSHDWYMEYNLGNSDFVGVSHKWLSVRFVLGNVQSVHAIYEDCDITLLQQLLHAVNMHGKRVLHSFQQLFQLVVDSVWKIIFGKKTKSM